MNNVIYVMTYNVSWESLESVNSGRLDMTHCKVKDINLCVDNIAQIIGKIGIKKNNSNLFDFIALKEINDSKNQWVSLQNKMNPLLLSKMNVEFTKIGKAGIITMYDKKYSLITKIEGNLSTGNDIRPYHILVFNQNIIFINLHMPHQKQNESFKIIYNQIKKIIQINQKLINYKIIMGGDFNNNNPIEFKYYQKISQLFEIKLNQEPNKLTSCCTNISKSTYQKTYDHIFSNLQYLTYYTLEPIDYFESNDKKMMSDHLPIFASFNNIQKRYLIEYN